MSPTPSLIGSRDVQVILDLSRSAVNRQAAEGRLPTVGKLAGPKGSWVFDREQIEKLAGEPPGDGEPAPDAEWAAS